MWIQSSADPTFSLKYLWTFMLENQMQLNMNRHVYSSNPFKLFGYSKAMFDDNLDSGIDFFFVYKVVII